jgi:predicted O-methyltransferase YrrM
MLSIENIFSKMHSLYAGVGLQILGGYSNFLVQPQNGAQFNFVADEKALKSTSGGIANDEATFLFGICRYLEPQNILIIGNSYGVSTVFLSLTNLDSKIVAIDKYRVTGNALTRELLKDLGTNVILEASTPDELVHIIETHMNGLVDLCLIDAVHTDEVQTAEFKILQNYMSTKSIIVFHDVISTDLMKSFSELKNINNEFKYLLATKTSSGLGLAIKGPIDPNFSNFLDYYTHSLDTVYKFRLTIESLGRPKYFNDNSMTALEIPSHPQT